MTVRARAASAATLASAATPVGLVSLAAAVGGYVLAIGFTHVSDDDYARVVIAETFARAPRLDPSGTSWLPFPFWLNGVVLAVFGRSLATARAAAFVIGALSVVPPYLAARALGVARRYAALGAALALATPWVAWLGVATVPEALTGALVASGAMLAGAPRGRVWGGVALLVAALSRYEAWPVCAGFALLSAYDAARGSSSGERDRPSSLALAAIVAAAGPAAWMLWNAHAHGSALHFFARVAAFRQSTGAADAPVAVKLLTYPQALVESAPWLVSLTVLGAIALADRSTRRRWGRPLALGVLLLGFLVYGDVHDGAPTHHPERALVALFWLMAIFGVDGARALALRVAWARPKREMWVVAFAAAAAIAWLVAWPAAMRAYPGQRDDEARNAQVARGEALRAAGARAVVITPCAYEHFALLASLAAHDDPVVLPPTHAAVTAECPRVLVRP